MSDVRRIAIALELQHPHPWHQQIYSGTQRYAREAGDWQCIIQEDPQLGFQFGGSTEKSFDGIIARASPDLVSYSRREHVPIVNTWYSTTATGISGVYPDLIACGQLAAKNFLDRGLHQFGIISNMNFKCQRVIRDGFLSALSEEGKSQFSYFSCDYDYSNPEIINQSIQKMNDWLDQFQSPFGLFIESLFYTRQLIHLCQLRGWSVPEDFAIICGHNDPEFSRSPSISAIDFNFEEIGYAAARKLDQMIRCGDQNGLSEYIPPRGVIERDSTDHYHSVDEIVRKSLDYISRNLDRHITIDQIASEVGASTRTLQRKFYKHLGRAPSAELRRLRISLAKRLLGDEEKTVKEVAFQAGFSDSKRFREAFLAEEGVSPSEYRKKTASTMIDLNGAGDTAKSNEGGMFGT